MNAPSKTPVRWAVLSTAALLLAATAASAAAPHIRDGWMFGVAYGYSAGRITLANESEGTAKGGATPQVRFGHVLGEHAALGVEYNGWMLEDGLAELKVRSSLQQVLLAGTWYPGNRDHYSGGFYVRGGVGLGWGSLAVVEIVDQIQQEGERVDETGLALMAGIGYEFRIARNVAAGMGAGFNYLTIDKDIYKSGWFTPFTGTVSWYWD